MNLVNPIWFQKSESGFKVQVSQGSHPISSVDLIFFIKNKVTTFN